MSANAAHKRQMNLLKRIAADAHYRTDQKLNLERFDSGLTVSRGEGGFIVKKDHPASDATNILAYDFGALRQCGLIDRCYLGYNPGKMGEVIYHTPGVQIKREGIDRVRELERSWWAKAIEKQPMTFVQVVFAILNFIGFAANLYFAWQNHISRLGGHNQ